MHREPLSHDYHFTIQYELKKKETGFDSKFSKLKKDIKNWFQCMIALLFYFHLVHIVHSYLAMDGCTAINFVKRHTCQNSFCPSWRCLRCMHDMRIFVGTFTTKQQFMHPHCIVYYKPSFDMLYKNYCWAAIPDPIWMTNVPYERKIKMLLSPDNNFMIFLFEFERFRIESQFPFLFSFLLTLYCEFCDPIFFNDVTFVYSETIWLFMFGNKVLNSIFCKRYPAPYS